MAEFGAELHDSNPSHGLTNGGSSVSGTSCPRPRTAISTAVAWPSEKWSVTSLWPPLRARGGSMKPTHASVAGGDRIFNPVAQVAAVH
jgi:hypothetical protein